MMLKLGFLLVFCVLLPVTVSQYYLTVTPATTETNLPTTYQFEITTSLSVVPAGTVVRIAFPTQYTFSATSMNCSNVFWQGAPSQLNCNYSGNLLSISNGFPSDLSNQYIFQFNASTVVNPLPAGVTGSFVVTFMFLNGTNDSSTGVYTVAISEGQAVCTHSIANGLVSAMGTVTIGFTPKNNINNGSVTSLAVTMARSYPNDTTNTDVTPSIPGSTVVGTYRFNLSMQSQFSLTLLMPSSTQPVANFVKVTSYIAAGNIDSCYISIDGVNPNNFTSASLSTGRVQTTATLSVNFINLSPLYPTDQLTLQLPADIGIQNIGTSVSFVRGIIGTRNITVLNGVVTIWNVSTATLIKTNTTFLLSNVVLPYSTKQLQVGLTSQTNTGYLKDSTYLAFAAQMGTLTALSIACDTSELGYSTNCTLSLTTQSSLNSNSSLTFSFPVELAISGGNYQCPTTGTQGVRSNCTNFFANNSISVTSLTSGTIPGGTVVTVRLPLTLPSFPSNYAVNFSTWGSALIDTGSAVMTTTSRLLLPAEFTVAVGTQVTYTPTFYVFTLVVPITVSTPMTALISIPVDPQGVLSCNGGAILSSFSKPVLSLGLSAASAASTFTLNVSGLLTPVSTQPISISVQIVSSGNSSLVYFYASSITLQVTQPRVFQYCSGLQSSSTVYTNTSLTVTLSGLQPSSILQITGTQFGVGCSTGSNIASIACTPIGNGVQLNITTDGIDTSDSRRYSFAVGLITPPFIGSIPISVNSFTANRLYSQATGNLALSASLMNALSITLAQSNPYFRENSTYTFQINATTPGCTQLSLSVPATYLFVAATGLSSCAFVVNDNNLLTFSLSASQNIKLQLQLTNPDVFSSFFLKTYSNQGDMDSGSFLPANACGSLCRSCTADPNSCTSCYAWSSSNKLDNNTCLSACPDGKYFNLSCQPCGASCTNCSNSTNCFTCAASLLLFNNTCLSQCPNGYYSSTATCIACPSTCSRCTSITNCSACTSNYSLINITCVSTCPLSTYSLNNICLNCSSGCLNCTYLQCTACNSTTLIYNGQCVSACPTGLFVDSATKTCVTCRSPCVTCANTSSSCLSCVSGTYLLVADCLSTCPDNYYPNILAGVCSQCVSPCLFCSSATVCLSCVPGQYIYQNTCWVACPARSYASNSSACSACQSPCLSCTSLTACTSCSSNLLLFNLTCLTACPPQFYNSSGVCTQCVAPCLDCQSVTVCLSCITGFYYNGSCQSSCPSGTYNSSNVCNNCLSPCSSCQGTASNCISCLSGFILLGVTCLSTCPSGYYPSSGICLTCVSPCASCSSASLCLSCNRSSASPYYSPDGTCVGVCSGGLHLNPSAFVCEACQAPCFTCLQSTQCLTCTTGFIYTGNSSCSLSCPSGSYNLSNNCVSCPALCETCQLKDSVVCLSCATSALFLGNICVASCPANTYAYYNHCVSSECPVSNCLKCSSLNCLQCSAYFQLNSNNTCTFNFTPSTVIDNIKAGKIIPFPFLATAIVAILALAAVKTQFKDMYLPVSLYAAVGLTEVGALALWVYFGLQAYPLTEGIFGILVLVAAALYLLSNLLNLLCYIPIRRDRKYALWIMDHCLSTTLVMCISTAVSFRFSRIQFSKLGGWELFSAKLADTNPYLYYNVLTVTSLGYLNLYAIVLCGIMSYNQSSMNQLFFSSLEVVFIEVAVLAIGLAEVVKPKKYLLEQEQDYIHGNDSDSIKVGSLKCLNEELQSVANLDSIGKHSLAEAFVSDKESSHNLNSEEIEIHLEEEQGDAASPARSMRGVAMGVRLPSPEEQAYQEQRQQQSEKLQQQAREEALRLEEMTKQQLSAEEEVQRRMLARQELERKEVQAQLEYEEIQQQFEVIAQREQAERRNKSELLLKYEEQLKQKERQERELKQRLKNIEDEEEQERRAALKQRREWQLMDIQDHLSRQREFLDALRQNGAGSAADMNLLHRATPEEDKQRKLEELHTLAELNIEYYRQYDLPQNRHFKKKKKKPIDFTHRVLLHKEGSLSSNSEGSHGRSKSRRSLSPSLKDSKESFIAQFEDREGADSEKITRVSELNLARTSSPNLKTIEEEEAKLREDEQRFDRNRVDRMVVEAQRKASQYLNSLGHSRDFETIENSDGVPRRIRHDASMPLPSGKINMKSTRSYKEGIGKLDLQQEQEINPIEEEDEEGARHQQFVIRQGVEIEDFRNSIQHSLSVRRDLQPQQVNIRARQSQALEPSAKDLQLERIYLQSIDYLPSKNGRSSTRKTTTSSWQNSRNNTSPGRGENRYQ